MNVFAFSKIFLREPKDRDTGRVAFFSDVLMQMVSNMDVSSYLVVSLACVGFEDDMEFIAFIYPLMLFHLWRKVGQRLLWIRMSLGSSRSTVSLQRDAVVMVR